MFGSYSHRCRHERQLTGRPITRQDNRKMTLSYCDPQLLTRNFNYDKTFKTLCLVPNPPQEFDVWNSEFIQTRIVRIPDLWRLHMHVEGWMDENRRPRILTVWPG